MTRSMAPDPGAPGAVAGAVTPSSTGIRRTVTVLGGVILGVALAGLLIVLLTGRPAATYPADSPEAALQGYLTAWEARDLDTAYAAFSDRIRGSATLDEYRRMDAEYGWARNSDRRVVLAGSRVNGDRATLDLRIDEFSSGGLLGGGDAWSSERSVLLVRDGGHWHVDELLIGLEPMAVEKLPPAEMPVDEAPAEE